MVFFVTGGAGFIGSHFIDRLLSLGHYVVCYDNLSTGHVEFLATAINSSKFKFIRGDLLDVDQLTTSLNGCDFVIHLAANADVRHGPENPYRDFEQNTICTYNILEAMRKTGVAKIAFSSTGSIYGEATIVPTPEQAPFPVQTSLYGASKLACEGLIQAFSECFGIQSWIFRLVSVLGERYTHGHVYDFYFNLLENPKHIFVLGNGHQRKSYMYVGDCIDGILLGMNKSNKRINIFNLGNDEAIEVIDSLSWILDYLELSPKITFSGGKRGWIGDNPLILLDCSAIRSLGWSPKFDIYTSVIKTIDWLKKTTWLQGVSK